MKQVLSVLLLACSCYAQNYEFPDGFLFGVSTASYQVEGAWNVSGKGESNWDHLTHTNPNHITDLSNGDVACDTYHKTAEDMQLLKNLGVNIYRFSLSWPRILPSGYVNYINPDGIRYYNELIDELLANDITPLITIYHWDLPQSLQEIGGWTNPNLAGIFEDYVDVVFSAFGDRVKHWLTFNEPYISCQLGYSRGILAPAYTQDGLGGYLCGHTVLVAHAKAYHLYEEKYREIQQGKVGITLDADWEEPNSNSEEDKEAAETTLQMRLGWFAHPIFSEDGDYPPLMRQRIDALSEEEGFSSSRLPYFTEEEVELLRGSADFLGLNSYTTEMCSAMGEDEYDIPSYANDVGTYCYQPDEWESTASSDFRVVPWGLRSLLNWIKDEYNNPEIVITENGYSDNTGDLYDCRRGYFFNAYLEQMLAAIVEDECNVTGYSAWSFMDNFEWVSGYTTKYGLFHVDFDDADRPRSWKMSAYVYKNIIENRRIDWRYTPEGFEACDWD